MSVQTTGRSVLLVTGVVPMASWCRFTPNSAAPPTVVSNFGFLSITRSGTGIYDFVLAERLNDIGLPKVSFVKSDATYHEFVISNVTSTGFRLTHLQGAYAGTPAAADNTGLSSVDVYIHGEQT